MSEYEHVSHTVHDIKYHFVCLAKYSYKVLAKTIREGLKSKKELFKANRQKRCF